MASRNVSNEELEEAARLDQDTVRFHPEKIVRSLEERSDVDHAGALAVSRVPQSGSRRMQH